MVLKQQYTTGEVVELTKVSYALLKRLRKGASYEARAGVGKTKRYVYDAVLSKPGDWFWESGKVIYTRDGVKKIQDYIKNGEYWKRQQ